MSRVRASSSALARKRLSQSVRSGTDTTLLLVEIVGSNPALRTITMSARSHAREPFARGYRHPPFLGRTSSWTTAYDACPQDKGMRVQWKIGRVVMRPPRKRLPSERARGFDSLIFRFTPRGGRTRREPGERRWFGSQRRRVTGETTQSKARTLTTGRPQRSVGDNVCEPHQTNRAIR